MFILLFVNLACCLLNTSLHHHVNSFLYSALSLLSSKRPMDSKQVSNMSDKMKSFSFIVKVSSFFIY